jgi:hypothetical protein
MIHHRTAFMAHPSDELYMPILGKGHKGFPLHSFHIQLLIANCPTNRDHLSSSDCRLQTKYIKNRENLTSRWW